MEAFSLLKYWRGGGGGVGVGLAGAGTSSDTTPTSPTPNAATILAAVAQNQNATESDDDDGEGGDDGPFFDLEFTVPEDEVDNSEDGHENPNANREEEEGEEEVEEEETDGEREFKFTLSPSSNDRSDPNLSLSPSEDLFFKGKLVQVEAEPTSSSEPNSKPQFTASLMKSATKFRVFMLGLKKPKSEPVATSSSTNQPEPNQKKQQGRRPQRIKFKVEEVPIVSLFTRDNSSKGSNKSQQLQPQNVEGSTSSSSKEVVMQKYLKMVKPLYIRVSRRYGEKLGLGQLNLSSVGAKATEGETVAETAGTNVKSSQKQGNLPAGLRVVYKHLGKSRSASSAVAASPPASVSSKRRDDSLLQQQDGIQGAILHCKRSFNASRECETSQLPRAVSDPLREILSSKSNDMLKKEEEK